MHQGCCIVSIEKKLVKLAITNTALPKTLRAVTQPVPVNG